jgi:OmpA-OmpF porin, OOP family
MEKKMTVVNAEKGQSNIRAEARMAFYGVFFDFDKPDSEAQVAEMALFLKRHADTRVYVTGPTDTL